MPHTHTANDRFKARFGTGFWIGLTVATLLHAALFIASPTFAISAPSSVEGVTMRSAVPEPLIEPPAPLQRPPAPKITPTRVDDPSSTIPPNVPTEGHFGIAPPAPATESRERAVVFTPYDIAPELRNPREVQAVLERQYPPVLRDAGVEGSVGVWIHIDAEGRVLETRLDRTSGFDAFDRAAVRVVDRMRFSPAYNREQRVPVWVSLEIRFEVK